MAIRIIGTGRGLPKTVVTNDDLAKRMDTSDEWIRTRTGIGERRIASDETTAGMSVEAAKAAITTAGIEAAEIDVILVGTVSPDQCFPTVSCMVQKEIGAVHAVCYDLSAGCSGFLFALNTVYAYMKAGIYRYGLIIGAETLSKLLDWEDRSTCVLFGDGAGAAVVKSEPGNLYEMVQYSDGSRGAVLSCDNRPLKNLIVSQEAGVPYMYMNGQEVFKFALKKVPKCITEVLEKAKLSVEEIDYYVLHQANERIIQAVAKRLRVPEEKFPMNMEHYANTSAATIPILLDEMAEKGMLNRGDKLVLSGFGAGLTWGAAVLEW